MKYKKVLSASVMGLLTMISCFGGEIIIKNPYRNVWHTYNEKYKDNEIYSSSSARTSDGLVCGNDNHYFTLVDSIRFQFMLYNHGVPALSLAARTFDATAKNRLTSEVFEESFSFGGKEGKMIYKTDIKLGGKGRGNKKRPIIESLKIEVLHLSLNGVEWVKY